jgi:hypothetical protein
MCTTEKQQSSSSLDKKRPFRQQGKKPEEARCHTNAKIWNGKNFYKFKTASTETCNSYIYLVALRA